MKFVLALCLGLAGSAAFGTELYLGCDGQPNLIFDGVRSITLHEGAIQLVDETRNGASMSYQGIFVQSTPGVDSIYHLEMGVQVTIPQDLIDGKVSAADIQFSTNDYPYETNYCTVIK